MQGEHETIWDDERTLLHFKRVRGNNELLPAHWHNHLEILYIIEGKMTAYINDSVYELCKGDIIIVNPRDIHYTYIHEVCEYYLLQVPTVHLERMGTNWKLLYFSEYLPYSLNEKSLNRALAVVFEEMNRLDSEKEQGNHLLILIQLYQLLYLLYTQNSRLLTKQKKNRLERDFLRIEQSMEYVGKHFHRQLSLAEVSGYLMLSTEYFCRLFKKYTGQTFLEYVSQVRLSHFYEDLLQTDESITFLLDKNGITNYKTFLKAFKAVYGTTPYKLREGERNRD